MCLQGYLAHGDAEAAEQGLRGLSVPFFHHEFVRQAVTAALQSADAERAILSLLGRLSECGLVSSNQLAKVRKAGLHTSPSQHRNPSSWLAVLAPFECNALQNADAERAILSVLGRLSECGLVSSNQLATVRVAKNAPTHPSCQPQECHSFGGFA